MRLLANFGSYAGGWHLGLLREDAKTPAGRRVTFANQAALIKAIAKLQGDADEAMADLRRWGHGGVWVDLSPAQCRFFRIQ